MEWDLKQILKATGGKLPGRVNGTRFSGISTDSRNIKENNIFLALDGDNFRGADFIAQAKSRGAGAVIVSRKPTQDISLPVIMVTDTLQALGDLAACQRKCLKKIKIAAVTGSSGKTTVKDMTAAVLSEKFEVHKTKGNFNNLIGMPLSVLDADFSHDWAVFEMGMNRPGEIGRLTEIANPDISCLINIGVAHLGGFNNVHQIAEAKAEMFEQTSADSLLIINYDDALIRNLSQKFKQQKLSFGFSDGADVRAVNLQCRDNELSFTVLYGREDQDVIIDSIGRHNALNALAAISIALTAGISMTDIAKGLRKFKATAWRMQLLNSVNGFNLINDVYNANPDSVVAAIKTIAELKVNKQAFLILGDMLELGKTSSKLHFEVGKKIVEYGIDYVFSYGELAADFVEGNIAAGGDKKKSKSYMSKLEIIEDLKKLFKKGKLKKGDWILVKGSRGMKMESLFNELEQGL
jgi:UDP-N-acetylmuramoyl-tripeptide--D-alanyl-D-alanine ligase